jgi:hypothetical protein
MIQWTLIALLRTSSQAESKKEKYYETFSETMLQTFYNEIHH